MKIKIVYFANLLFIIFLMFCIEPPHYTNTYYSQNFSAIPKVSANHAPISINGNLDFANQAVIEGWDGDGSYGDPYIIANYTIDASTTNGITITGTDVYFIIENVSISGAGTKVGFFLDAKNAFLINNTVKDNYDGFSITYSSNITLTENTANNNDQFGFRIVSSSNITITVNEAYNNEWHGFYLDCLSGKNILTGNIAKFNGCGFGHFSSDNAIISGNTANYNHGGLLLSSSSYTTITGNIANNNDDEGFIILDSSYNTITGNSINSNKIGIYLDDSSYNTITGNTLLDNEEECIDEAGDSEENVIEDNDCGDNDDDTKDDASDIPGYNIIILNSMIAIVIFIIVFNSKKSKTSWTSKSK